jgi:indole-3-glycerol phosphate synthase
MPTYLADILQSHRARAALDLRDPDELAAEAINLAPPRDFEGALATGTLSCIAEVKRRSPSKGNLDLDLQPDVLAKEYLAGGASCLSILTDVEHFGGSIEDLQVAAQATGLPVLRKDFTVQEADVVDARLMGADAVLLIVAALSSSELVRFKTRADELGLAALVEVHDEAELNRAFDAGAQLIGVNQRDLRTFEVDQNLACSLAGKMPSDVIAVAESGIRNAEDARRLADAGFNAILVGETLVRSDDRVGTLASLVGHPVGPR